MDAICDDLGRARGARSVLVRDLPPDALGRATSPPSGWSATRSATCGSSTARRAWPWSTWTPSPRPAPRHCSADVDDGVDPSIAPGREVAPPQLLASWRDGRPRCWPRCARSTPGRGCRGTDRRWGALVRHGAADGDVGPRPGRRRRARRDAGADRAPAPRRPHRCAGATVRLRHPRPAGARASTCASSSPPPTARVDVGIRSADDRVSGDALDFCLVVTQRRHRATPSLVVEGPAADEWIGIAQAFAGPPARAAARPVRLLKSCRLDVPEIATRLECIVTSLAGDRAERAPRCELRGRRWARTSRPRAARCGGRARRGGRGCGGGRPRAASSSVAFIVDSNWLAWASSGGELARRRGR